MKVVLQDGIKDCGICCMLSIIRHYGGNVSKEYLREVTSTTKNGVTAYKLVESAEKLGFNAFALSGDIKNINVNNLPCIAHVIINKSYQHFIVIYEVDLKGGYVLAMDPARGKRIYSLSEFKLISSGCFIFMLKEKELPIFQSNKIIKKEVISISKSEKIYFVFLVLLVLSYFTFNILSAFHFKYFIDFCINFNNQKNLILLSIIMLIIYFLKEISSFLKNLINLKFKELLDINITMRIYKQIILLPYLYYKNRTTGEVVSRMNDLSFIKNFLSQILTTITTDLLCFFIFLIVLIKINKILTLFSLISFFILIIINIIFKNSRKRRIKNYHRREDIVNSYLIESLTSVDVIKGMHIEKIMIDRFFLKYQKLLESFYSISLLEEIINFIKNNICNVFQVINLALGSLLVIEKKISISELIVYQSVLSFFTSSFQNIINILHEYPNFLLSVERIEDLFAIRKEIFSGYKLYEDHMLEGDIVYNNLNYSYGKRVILKDINVTIHKGDKIFLCGESGSGKSTLMKLLMRYIEVDFGKININNIDINHYHLDILRKNITYISQQEFLFTDTILNNITLREDISHEEFLNAIKMTLVDEIINNEQLSYDKLIEENGFNFSGGERQRIILARSILKKSNIFIFDEALSQIDVERERKILKNLFKYFDNKIIIVISHRFNNKDLFDRCFRIKEGHLYEEKL